MAEACKSKSGLNDLKKEKLPISLAISVAVRLIWVRLCRGNAVVGQNAVEYSVDIKKIKSIVGVYGGLDVSRNPHIFSIKRTHLLPRAKFSRLRKPAVASIPGKRKEAFPKTHSRLKSYNHDRCFLGRASFSRSL